MFKVFIHDGTEEVPNDDIMYILAKEGPFIKKKLGLISCVVPVDKISILQSVESWAEMDIEKIPGPEFAKIISFFKEVYNELKSEAIVLLYYHEKKKKFWLRVPPQEVSWGGVDYQNFDNSDHYTYVGTVHSHASMNAFHSGTDKHDEEHSDGLHITIGDLDEQYVSLAISIVVNGKRVTVNPHDYIDQLISIEYEEKPTTAWWGSWATKNPKKKIGWMIDVPEEDKQIPSFWMDFVEKKVWKPTTKFVGGACAGRSGGSVIHSPSGSFVKGYPIHYLYGVSEMFLGGGSNILDDGESPCETCPYFDDLLIKLEEDYGFDFSGEEEEDEDTVGDGDDLPPELGDVNPKFVKEGKI